MYALCVHYKESPRTEPTVGIASERIKLLLIFWVLHSEMLRNSHHHQIRSMIANELRMTHQVEEEVHGISVNGYHRRIDMIAIPSGSTNGFIIEPTI